MEHIIAREERLELLRFLVALILFICALHVLCSRDNQAALARAQRLHMERTRAAGLLLVQAHADTASTRWEQAATFEFSH